MGYDPQTGRLTPDGHDETDGWIFTDEANIYRDRSTQWMIMPGFPMPIGNTTAQLWSYQVPSGTEYAGRMIYREIQVATNLFSLRDANACENEPFDRCRHSLDRNGYAADSYQMRFGSLPLLEERMERDGWPDDCLEAVLHREKVDAQDKLRGNSFARKWTSPTQYDKGFWNMQMKLRGKYPEEVCECGISHGTGSTDV